MFQVIEQAQKNQNDPMKMFKEVTKNYSPEQMENLFKNAKQFGISNEIIENAKKGINTKE